MSLQNPSIPTPINAIEIDSVVMDIQTKLDVNLSWLTHNYARAFRHIERKDSKIMYFPEVYTGIVNDVPSYYRVTPDSTRKGMCFFVVGKEENKDFNKDEYNYLSYNLGIVFWVNLGLIDQALLNTDLFTQNLIRDVRDVLTRKMLGTNYRLEIENVCREFNEVYREFSLDEMKNFLMAPFQAFRFNCNVSFQEDCIGSSVNVCNVLNQNISQNEVLTCLLPSLDFSNIDVFNSLSQQQKDDLIIQLSV